ncbi:hypothetical protein DdX_13863 [Ditylenchus destructor]|uniref:Uncharacterized protein n=1 Tax=Ditylenchus destructor TaxID=166010 RepID=A0AAD4MS70_9BILA|nr:hypothetical protein DdX_13863 [Ditylenchus destructor]
MKLSFIFLTSVISFCGTLTRDERLIHEFNKKLAEAEAKWQEHSEYLSNIVASIEEHFGKVDRIRIIGLGILDPDNNDDSDKQGQYIPSDIEAIFLQLQLALRLRRELSDSFGYGGLHITSEESDHREPELKFLRTLAILPILPTSLKKFGYFDPPTELKTLVFMPNSGSGAGLNNLIWSYRRNDHIKNLAFLKVKEDFTSGEMYDDEELAQMAYLKEYIKVAELIEFPIPQKSVGFAENNDFNKHMLYVLKNTKLLYPEPRYTAERFVAQLVPRASYVSAEFVITEE